MSFSRSWSASRLGAYLDRDLSGATGLVLFIGTFACIVGLNIAKTSEQPEIRLLFGLGIRLRLAVAPAIAYYDHADASAPWHASGGPVTCSPSLAPRRACQASPRRHDRLRRKSGGASLRVARKRIQ